MPCFKPIQAFYGFGFSRNGKRKIVFSKSESSGLSTDSLSLPCGQCVGCRLERSRQWAMRCMHEAQLHQDNCFITLTYDDKHLPKDRSLDVRDFQKFMKRLRRKFGNGIKFFHCGEYGEQFRRPHYHAILFGIDFKDKVFWRYSEAKNKFSSSGKIPIYRSNDLEELWPFGFSTIGSVTFESAAYVARYSLKKITGDKADVHYLSDAFDLDTGEVYRLKPEYTTMSRRSAIGKEWFEKYMSDVYPHDFVVVKGRKMNPPKFYDRCYEHVYPDDFQKIKRRRMIKAMSCAADNTPDRLEVKEKVVELSLEKLKRTL